MSRLERWLERIVVNRESALIGTTAAVFLTVIAAIVGLLLVWISGGSGSDKLTEVADVIAGSTGMLAVIAALVALIAFAAATGTPTLELEINFKGGHGPGVLRFTREANGQLAPGQDNLQQSDQLVALIKLSNASRFSARNPAVRLELMGFQRLGSFQGVVYQLGDEWKEVRPSNPDAAWAVQWDGGSNLSIHGDWARPLPELNLRGLYGIAGAEVHRIRFGVVADGFKREWIQDVELVG